MKVYKFIFFVGLINLLISFMGISFMYKQYLSVALAVITIAYALILRAIAKEKEHLKKEQTKHQTVSSTQSAQITEAETKTIEQVVDMKDKAHEPIVQAPKKRITKKEKILVASGFDHE